MSTTSRKRNLQDANAALIRVSRRLRRFDRVLVDELLDSGAERGPTSSGVSDPTGSLAVRTNRARTDEREADRLASRILKDAEHFERIVRYWTEEIPLKAEELAKLEREATPVCEVLAKVGGWEDAYQTSTVGGRLPRDYRLGRWAYDFVGKHDRLPTEAECRTHVDGRRVMVSA